jgi:hypothetical protein
MSLFSYLVVMSTILFIYNKIILYFFDLRQRSREYYYTIKFITIKQIVKYILNRYNIKNRQDLDTWCGGRNREKIYNEVEKYSMGWFTPDEIKKTTRRSYEAILPGYTNSCIKYIMK